MPYFAKIDNGIVSNVIVADNAFITDQDGMWIECFEQSEDCCNGTSNTHPRGNMASVGYSYDVLLDAFIPPKPYPSWVIDETTCRWIAPVAYPTDKKIYAWDETTLSWVEVAYPSPYPSWVKNETTGRWEAPLPPPEDDMSCTDDMCMCAVWVEDSQSWGRLSRSMPR